MVVKVVSSVHSENGGDIDTTAVDAMSTTSSTNKYCCQLGDDEGREEENEQEEKGQEQDGGEERNGGRMCAGVRQSGKTLLIVLIVCCRVHKQRK